MVLVQYYGASRGNSEFILWYLASIFSRHFHPEWRIQIGCLPPWTAHGGKALPDLLKWKGPLLVPVFSRDSFLVYIIKRLKKRWVELGLQHNQVITAWVFLSCCFQYLCASSGHHPSCGDVQNSASPALWGLPPEAHLFLIIWYRLCCKQDLPSSLLSVQLQSKLNIAALGPPSSLKFQPIVFSSVMDLLFSLIFGEYFCYCWFRPQRTLELWSEESSPYPLGADSGIFQGEASPSSPFFQYLITVLNPQSHLIHAQFIFHFDYQIFFYFPVFTLTNL